MRRRKRIKSVLPVMCCRIRMLDMSRLKRAWKHNIKSMQSSLMYPCCVDWFSFECINIPVPIIYSLFRTKCSQDRNTLYKTQKIYTQTTEKTYAALVYFLKALESKTRENVTRNKNVWGHFTSMCKCAGWAKNRTPGTHPDNLDKSDSVSVSLGT